MSLETPGALPTLLLIDADGASLNSVRLTLGQIGFTQVQTARDGRQGQQVLDGMAQAPDLIICDVFMPHMDGIEFMFDLAKRGYQGRVVLVDGGSDEMLSIAVDIAVALGLNVLAAFGKPLRADALQSLFGTGDGGLRRSAPSPESVWDERTEGVRRGSVPGPDQGRVE